MNLDSIPSLFSTLKFLENSDVRENFSIDSIEISLISQDIFEISLTGRWRRSSIFKVPNTKKNLEFYGNFNSLVSHEGVIYTLFFDISGTYSFIYLDPFLKLL